MAPLAAHSIAGVIFASFIIPFGGGSIVQTAFSREDAKECVRISSLFISCTIIDVTYFFLDIFLDVCLFGQFKLIF